MKEALVETLCKNFKVGGCPIGCTFWDCVEFEPTNYFMSGIKELKKEATKID